MKNNIAVDLSRPVMSFVAELEKVKEECEFYDALLEAGEENEKMLETMCKIITEVRRKPPQGYILIDREAVEVSEIQDVYGQIGAQELVYVLEQFKKADYEIKFVKSWLRTALYNSVFEAEARMENDVNVLFNEYKNGGGKND